MYCSKCGLAIAQNQAFCPGCGRPVVRNEQQAIEAVRKRSRERRVQRLSRYWYLFAGLNAALGMAGLIVFWMGVTAISAPLEPWPHPPGWGWTLAGHLGWEILISRAALALLAGWGLKVRADWAVPVSIVAGAVAFTQFPIGVIMGSYALVYFMGKGHGALHEHSA